MGAARLSQPYLLQRHELFYQRAVHACLTMLPALNTIGMRDGLEAAFGKGYNVLPV
jgi:hypothetical protein